ncbi:MAG: porin family protein [Cardiobacteriaceae bacterium]|nr:porin family protein [Cardiobacteriaceae bacterium]
MRFFLVSGLSLVSCVLYAATPQPAPPTPELHTPDEKLPSVAEKVVADKQSAHQENAQAVEVSEAELLANPPLLANALDSAIIAGNADGVAVLLPIYRKLPSEQQDKMLLRFGEALQARAKGDLAAAIAFYREMIAEDPSLQPVRLHLAMTLVMDHQDEAARAQLDKLKSEKLPDDIRKIVEQALATLRERRSWSFNAGGYYRYDNNINGAPRQRERQVGQGKWTFPEAKRAHGIHLDLSAERRIPIYTGWYGQVEGGLNADWFWDAHKFDDFRFRLGAGAGWQNSRWDVSLVPFVQRRIYDDKGYSTNVGADANISYWLTPQWRLSSSLQGMHKHHDTRKWLNGNQYFGSVSALYAPNARQYWFAGANAMRSQARDASEAFKRYGINIGWGQEWGWGMSSRVVGTYAHRSYDANDFFGILRKDHEYGTSVSLWNRNLYFWGITPRLTFSWNRTDSNHFYYDGHDSDVYLEFSRSF